MTLEKLIETLADAEHASWSRWMDYLFSKCVFENGGRVTIPWECVTRWMKQAATPYPLLSESEKESDRKEVQHILPAIHEYIEEYRREMGRSE